MNPTILGAIGPVFLNQDPTIDDLILYYNTIPYSTVSYFVTGL